MRKTSKQTIWFTIPSPAEEVLEHFFGDFPSPVFLQTGWVLGPSSSSDAAAKRFWTVFDDRYKLLSLVTVVFCHFRNYGRQKMHSSWRID